MIKALQNEVQNPADTSKGVNRLLGLDNEPFVDFYFIDGSCENGQV